MSHNDFSKLATVLANALMQPNYKVEIAKTKSQLEKYYEAKGGVVESGPAMPSDLKRLNAYAEMNR